MIKYYCPNCKASTVILVANIISWNEGVCKFCGAKMEIWKKKRKKK